MAFYERSQQQMALHEFIVTITRIQYNDEKLRRVCRPGNPNGLKKKKKKKTPRHIERENFPLEQFHNFTII